MAACSEDFYCGDDFDSVLASFVLIVMVQRLFRQFGWSIEIKKKLIVLYGLHSHIISIILEKIVY